MYGSRPYVPEDPFGLPVTESIGCLSDPVAGDVDTPVVYADHYVSASDTFHLTDPSNDTSYDGLPFE